MTPAPPRDLTGQLYRNTRKDRESQPDHTGSVTVAGVTYRLAAWIKEGTSGRYFSLKLTAPEGASEAAAPAAAYQPRTLLPGTYPEPLSRRGGERKPVMDEPIPF